MPRVVYLGATEDLPPRACDDEAGPRPAPVWRSAVVGLGFLLGAGEAIPQQAAQAAYAHESTRLTVARTLQRAVPFTDDEAFVAAAAPDQEEPWAGVRQAAPWVAAPFADDDLWVPSLGIDQEEPWVAQVEGVPWLARPFLDDEFSTSLSGTPDDEAFWVARRVAGLVPAISARSVGDFMGTVGPPAEFGLDDEKDSRLPAVLRQPWAAIRFADDEIRVTPPTPFGLDDERAWEGVRESQPWVARPFSDDETFAWWGLPEDGYVPMVYTAAWALCAFDDDEVGAQLVNPTLGVDDEVPGVAARVAAPWLARPFSDDETGAQLRNFFSDQEEPWAAQAQAVPWRPAPFADDEIRVTPAGEFFLEDDPPFKADRQAQPWLPRPSSDDETGAQLTNFSLDLEEPARWAVQCVPWLAQPFTDDEIRAAAAAPNLRPQNHAGTGRPPNP